MQSKRWCDTILYSCFRAITNPPYCSKITYFNPDAFRIKIWSVKPVLAAQFEWTLGNVTLGKKSEGADSEFSNARASHHTWPATCPSDNLASFRVIQRKNLKLFLILRLMHLPNEVYNQWAREHITSLKIERSKRVEEATPAAQAAMDLKFCKLRRFSCHVTFY